MNRLDLYKNYLKIDYDEELFDLGYHISFKKEPNIDIKSINNANKAEEYLEKNVKSLEYELEKLEDNKESFNALSDIMSEQSVIFDAFQNSQKTIEELQDWGSNWKSIAMEFFKHIIEHHINELEDIGICRYNVTENEIKSLETINKFNL